MPDSLPQWIQPMLAKLFGSLPADDQRWAYEMKWDGIRGLAFIEHGKLRLMTAANGQKAPEEVVREEA